VESLKKFDAYFKELMAFKNTFGHFNAIATILWEDGPVVLERHMKS
jgi:hypothetical protein